MSTINGYIRDNTNRKEWYVLGREIYTMTSVSISFWDMDSIIKFIEIMESYTYDMELSCGHYAVDARSVLSVFAMRNARNLELKIDSSECDDVLKDLEVYRAQWNLEHERVAVC